MSKEKGLYEKYTVINNETAKPVEGFTFTLSPEKDPAAAYALKKYAEMTTNEQLATEIECYIESMEMIGTLKMPQECSYCEEPAPKLRSSPYMADIGAEMCKHCWDLPRSRGKNVEGTDIGEF
ncbi:hypothetical protein ACI2JA_15570 [Alkalihalobacillus sp. NPDC078783]